MEWTPFRRSFSVKIIDVAQDKRKWLHIKYSNDDNMLNPSATADEEEDNEDDETEQKEEEEKDEDDDDDCMMMI